MASKHVVLERLNKLVAQGYVVRWGKSEQDTLHLQHPRAPDLTLFSDGRIWVLTPSPDEWISSENGGHQARFQLFESPNDWIGAESEADKRRFKSFIARVPKPTMLQRLKAMTVEDVWLRFTLWTLLMVFALVLAFLLAGFGGL